MAIHNDLGKKGEALAVEFLQKNNYQILELNWRFKKAEIDVIAKKNDVLAVVEVKTRSSNYFGNPQDFVNPKKDMSLEDYKNISKDVNDLFWLDIGGGEPFLRKDLYKIVNSNILK